MATVCTEDIYGLQTIQKIPEKLTMRGCLPQLNGFLGIAPLSHGVVILSCFYGITAFVSMTVNMMLYHPVMSFACILVYIFGCYMLITWVLATLGVIRVNKDKSIGMRRALAMWTIFIVMWIFLVVLSFSKNGATLLCVEHRCPETYWIYNETWHDLDNPKPTFRSPVYKDNLWETFAAWDDELVRKSSSRYEWEATPSLLTTLIKSAMKNDDKNALFRIDNPPETTYPDKGNDSVYGNHNPFGHKNRDPDDQQSANHTVINLLLMLFMIAINAVLLIYSWLILLNCKLNIEQCVREAEIDARRNSKQATLKLFF